MSQHSAAGVGRGGLAGLAFGPMPPGLRLPVERLLQPADLRPRHTDGPSDPDRPHFSGCNTQAEPLARTVDLFCSLGQRNQLVIPHAARFYAPHLKNSTYSAVDQQSN